MYAYRIIQFVQGLYKNELVSKSLNGQNLHESRRFQFSNYFNMNIKTAISFDGKCCDKFEVNKFGLSKPKSLNEHHLYSA